MGALFTTEAAECAESLGHSPVRQRDANLHSSSTAAWDFYRSIGSPKFVVAPMVNQSELAFRTLTRTYNGELCYTPMLNSKMFATSSQYRKKMMVTNEADRPLIVQFCGHDPQMLLAAAKLVQDQCDAVDINLGCPQGIARKGRYGAFLLEETELLREMVSTLHKGLKVPVTCKIRILKDEEKTLALCHMLQENGCQLLTVHGRTKEQNKHTMGSVNLRIIKRIKQELSIPVFANGGVSSLEDVKRIMNETGVDGVMSSEAILGNPALFTGREVTPEELARKYLSFVNPKDSEDVAALRPHLFKILFREFAVHTDIRNSFGEGAFFGTGASRRDVVQSSLAMVSALEAAKQKTLAEAKNAGEKTDPYRRHPIWYDRYRKSLAHEDDTADDNSGSAEADKEKDREGEDGEQEYGEDEGEEEEDGEAMAALFEEAPTIANTSQVQNTNRSS